MILITLLLSAATVLGRPGAVQEYPVECTASTDGFPVFIPHPTNCTLYYQCQGDWPILMECAPPLYFDPSLDVCNYPDLVDCQQPTTEEPEVSTTESDDSTSTNAEQEMSTSTLKTTTSQIITEDPILNTTSTEWKPPTITTGS